MHSITAAVLKAGILSDAALAEFRRWGFEVSAPPSIPQSPEELTIAIEEALQSEGLVLTRETDLEAVNYYLQSQREGDLSVTIEGDGEEVTSTFACTYGITPLGEFIIRWHSDAIDDVMTNGKTHLTFRAPETLNEDVKVYFCRVREVFFGETKAFIICTPVKTDG